ncbi:Mu transposase domain-containing protein, partial [Pseudomonas syringae]|uniref:Mu transposase domain-containing protein n=1 Tax=Pseudomonas syringae TaxID=317 RepID=UPI003F65FF9A
MARNRYSVPCERVGQWVSSRLYPSRIVVIADETVIASHERLFDRDQVGPCERVGQWVSSRLYPSRIVVIADETVIASHERLFDRDQVGFDWQHYIPLIERKPGALRN